jgi:hypothetical protein
MNERIIELAKQAGLELSTVLKDYVTPIKSITIEQRKFAELIVKECAQIAKDTQDWYADNNPSGIVNTDISAKINHRFGVEE